MLRSGLTLLMILLAAPAWAGNHFGGGSHGGGFHGGGIPGGGFPGGVVYGGHLHDDGFTFHRNVRRSRDLLVVYGYGYNCGFGFDCGVYDSGLWLRLWWGRRGKCRRRRPKRQRRLKQQRRLCPRPRRRRNSDRELSQFVLGPPSRVRSIRRFCGASPDRPLPSLG